MENNKVKVAVIQESKLTPKSKKTASRITPQYVRTVLMAMAEDYLSSSIDR